MRTISNPKHPNNDWYEELCALAAIGELSASEFEELRGHLNECESCRELYADFRRVSTDDLGMAAVARRTELEAGQDDNPGESLNEQELLNRFLDRAQREETVTPSPAPPAEIKVRPSVPLVTRISAWWRRPALSYGTVALLLCAVAGLAAYRLKEAQLTPAMDSLSSQVQEWKDRAANTQAREQSASQSLQQVQAQRDALQQALADADSKTEELRGQQKTIEAQVTALQQQLQQKEKDLDSAAANADDKTKQAAQLQTRLQAALQRTTEQESIADSLRLRLQHFEQTAASQPAQSASVAPSSGSIEDADVRNLFGARDLHIVDVYDVDSAGKTKRTFGRIYYAEKKILIFYAFDLQDKRHNRAAAGFQAWGYGQPNESKPEDLGLFYVDDASLSRWVLKVKNPKVLEHVDAVFVTLEPPNGSPTPQGRRLLYANLAGPANHP